jgi:hypothetical protein
MLIIVRAPVTNAEADAMALEGIAGQRGCPR